MLDFEHFSYPHFFVSASQVPPFKHVSVPQVHGNFVVVASQASVTHFSSFDFEMSHFWFSVHVFAVPPVPQIHSLSVTFSSSHCGFVLAASSVAGE